MLKALARFVGLFQTEEDELEEADAENVSERAVEEREFFGNVSSLHNDYGIINSEVYFSRDLVSAFEPALRVGDRVIATAERQGIYGGWRATRVVPSPEYWDDLIEGDAETAEVREEITQVGVVSQIDRQFSGRVNSSLYFDREALSDDFLPGLGDWVSVDCERTSGGVKVLRIKPLRTIEFTGEVNATMGGFGFVNRDIYFRFDVCQAFQPSRGDRVKGTAVESTQKKCTWRATHMELVPNQPRRNSSSLDNHYTTHNHMITDLEADKGGIAVTQCPDFGLIGLAQQKSGMLWIRNIGQQAHTLNKCVIRASADSQFGVDWIRPVPFDDSTDGHTNQILPVLLTPGSVLAVQINCTARNLGRDRQLLLMQFDSFEIGRFLTALVTDDDVAQLADSSVPYLRSNQRPNQRHAADNNDTIIPGQRPGTFKRNLQLPMRLAKYPVPEQLRKCLWEGEDPSLLVPVIKEELSMANYAKRFSALLYLEEIKMEIDIREYDLQRVCLRRFGEYLALLIPGLAEGRPSVLVGDQIILSVPGDETGPKFAGYVHEIMAEEVLLKFHESFHADFGGEDYDVTFSFNRTPMRRCYQVVEHADQLGRAVLFPDRLEMRKALFTPKLGHSTRTMPQTEHKFFNSILNDRQKSAVLRILAGQCRPSPYVLFGPPGTGKTVTVVEAILQVATQLPSARILACAPSNSAADLLAERLIQSGELVPGSLVRLNAFRRLEESVSDVLKPYCSSGENLVLVSRHRLIIATCTTAASLYSLGLSPGHFTHAFIDEAGQATEPECMCAVNLVAPCGVCVLAGDPMQLGPVLRSQPAKAHGLQVSYLERLMARRPYLRDTDKFTDHGDYDPHLVTKLVKNYRSHPSLLSLTSALFYHGELEVCADVAQRECLCEWDQLPKTGVPLIFHGIRGEDMREGDSPSWFNAAEAVQTMRYLQSLVNNDVHPLTFDDIGIITPYRKQVEKICLLIDKLGMSRVKVGSVEEFQGQERLVLILSLVRSDSRLLRFDEKYNLGFLTNPKRFNVAITRPQALLIVLGNPHVLVKDFFWRKLLEYSVQLGAYTGCDLPQELCAGVMTQNEDSNRDVRSESDLPTVAPCPMEGTTAPEVPNSNCQEEIAILISPCSESGTTGAPDSGIQSDVCETAETQETVHLATQSLSQTDLSVSLVGEDDQVYLNPTLSTSESGSDNESDSRHETSLSRRDYVDSVTISSAPVSTEELLTGCVSGVEGSAHREHYSQDYVLKEANTRRSSNESCQELPRATIDLRDRGMLPGSYPGSSRVFVVDANCGSTSPSISKPSHDREKPKRDVTTRKPGKFPKNLPPRLRKKFEEQKQGQNSESGPLPDTDSDHSGTGSWSPAPDYGGDYRQVPSNLQNKYEQDHWQIRPSLEQDDSDHKRDHSRRQKLDTSGDDSRRQKYDPSGVRNRRQELEYDKDLAHRQKPEYGKVHSRRQWHDSSGDHSRRQWPDSSGDHSRRQWPDFSGDHSRRQWPDSSGDHSRRQWPDSSGPSWRQRPDSSGDHSWRQKQNASNRNSKMSARILRDEIDESTNNGQTFELESSANTKFNEFLITSRHSPARVQEARDFLRQQEQSNMIVMKPEVQIRTTPPLLFPVVSPEKIFRQESDPSTSRTINSGGQFTTSSPVSQLSSRSPTSLAGNVEVSETPLSVPSVEESASTDHSNGSPVPMSGERTSAIKASVGRGRATLIRDYYDAPGFRAPGSLPEPRNETSLPMMSTAQDCPTSTNKYERITPSGAEGSIRPPWREYAQRKPPEAFQLAAQIDLNDSDQHDSDVIVEDDNSDELS